MYVQVFWYRIPILWWCHISLYSVEFVLMQLSFHLFFMSVKLGPLILLVVQGSIPPSPSGCVSKTPMVTDVGWFVLPYFLWEFGGQEGNVRLWVRGL